VTQAPDSPPKPGRRRLLRLPRIGDQAGPEPDRLYLRHRGQATARHRDGVSRIRRDDANQNCSATKRPENLAHVKAIRRYLDTDPSPMLPKR